MYLVCPDVSFIEVSFCIWWEPFLPFQKMLPPLVRHQAILPFCFPRTQRRLPLPGDFDLGVTNLCYWKAKETLTYWPCSDVSFWWHFWTGWLVAAAGRTGPSLPVRMLLPLFPWPNDCLAFGHCLLQHCLRGSPGPLKEALGPGCFQPWSEEWRVASL